MSHKINLLIAFGTRPEAIKLAPLIKLLAHSPTFEVQICVTGQHRQMLDQVLDFFEILPDFDLNLMQEGQNVSEITSRVLNHFPTVLNQFQPDIVLVHGDTATAFSVALASFHHHIPVVHIEAGLRSHCLQTPFPEEANRRLTSVLASLHFAPTHQAKANLMAENVPESQIFVTGNTVIDALQLGLQKIEQNQPLAEKIHRALSDLSPNKKTLLVTVHRQENLGENLAKICDALLELAKNPTLQIVFPLHLNPKIQHFVREKLAQVPSIFLQEPLDYPHFLALMQRADLILTDSGGLQEEATALQKMVLLLREQTERPEAVEAGVVKLIGSQTERIVAEVVNFLQNPTACSSSPTLYGNGTASQQILAILQHHFEQPNEKI